MFDFKKIISLLLVLLLALSFTACSAVVSDEGDIAVVVPDNSTADKTESTVSNGSKWDYGTDESETKLTLDDAEVRLVYFNDTYAEHDLVEVLVAYHGPDEEVSFGMSHDYDGELEALEGPYYHKFDNGWVFLYAYGLKNGTSLENLSVVVFDNSGEEIVDRVFTDFGEAMTKEELIDIGAHYFGDDIMCTVTTENRLMSDDDYAAFLVGFNWYNFNYLHIDHLPEGLDISDFAFFTSDGTPLSELDEGYDYSVEFVTNDNGKIESIFVNFEVNDGDTTEGRTNDFCKMLSELEVYMIYTDGEGVRHRFDNILTQPAK